MKTLILSLTFLLTATICFGQETKIKTFTDFDIAIALIGMDTKNLDEIIQSYDVEYWITDNSEGKVTLYITNGESIKRWTLHFGNLVREINGVQHTILKDIIKEVYIRYRHSNMNDLKDFFAYEIPEDEKYKIFEKELGREVSHMKITIN